MAVHLHEWVDGVSAEDTIDDALLVASELVGNAVRHCTGRIGLCVERLAEEVEISVSDDSTKLPAATDAVPTSESGRGLTIVGALCSAWGVRPVAGHGKAVWGRVPTVVARSA
ncbi:ATP-binding protein [Acidiferrimicrobium sp. IK]|nr:ATP-binding protein [Acidiferrimicrobium sp. IK]